MSMHLRGSKDMMRNEDEGWWTSKTGLEQKLIILSSILFIISFSLTITVIVLKNRSNSGECTTVAPPTTGSTPVTGDTSTGSDSTVASSTGATPSTSPEPPSTSPEPPSTSPEPSSTNPKPPSKSPEPPESTSTPATTPEKSSEPKEEAAPLEKSKSSPLISLFKEARRVNSVLKNMKEEEELRGA
ncbi:unnamed protein product [Larinioides sclopetarius]|uniref:Uncharacterized protein n=1 Tax=Larinioides sclopetarius TaxID=280406 RepID=A0AAV2AE33_9ARAC